MRNWNGSKWIRKEKRLAIYARDLFGCVYCGMGVEDEIVLTLDHVIAVEHGGTNDESNLVTCCRTCNCSKGMRLLEEFAVAVASYRNGKSGTATEILARVKQRTADPLKPYRKLAKRIIEGRGSYTQAMEHIGGQ